MRKLYKMHPDMTAVFVTNYEMTVGAMMEINDLGIRVPDELSVIGFDNVDFAKGIGPEAQHCHTAYSQHCKSCR